MSIQLCVYQWEVITSEDVSTINWNSSEGEHKGGCQVVLILLPRLYRHTTHIHSHAQRPQPHLIQPFFSAESSPVTTTNSQAPSPLLSSCIPLRKEYQAHFLLFHLTYKQSSPFSYLPFCSLSNLNSCHHHRWSNLFFVNHFFSSCRMLSSLQPWTFVLFCFLLHNNCVLQFQPSSSHFISYPLNKSQLHLSLVLSITIRDTRTYALSVYRQLSIGIPESNTRPDAKWGKRHS